MSETVRALTRFGATGNGLRGKAQTLFMHTRTLFVLPFVLVALIGCARGLDFGGRRNPDAASMNLDAGSTALRAMRAWA